MTIFVILHEIYSPDLHFLSWALYFLNRMRPISFCWTRKAIHHLTKTKPYFVILSLQQENVGCGVWETGRSVVALKSVEWSSLDLAVRVSELSISEVNQRHLCLFSPLAIVNMRLRNKFSTYSSRPTICLFVPNQISTGSFLVTLNV